MAGKNPRVKTRYTGIYYRLVRRIGGRGDEKAFYAVYKLNGRTVETLLGYEFRDDMTAAKAARLRGELVEGKRQTREEKRKERARNLSLARLWETYRDEHLTNAGTKRTDAANFNNIPKEIVAKIPLEITTRDMESMKRKLFARGLAPQTVKHAMTLVQRLIRWGKKNGLCQLPNDLEFNFPRLDNEKTENLTPEQMLALLKALDEDQDQESAAIMRLALYTGIRRRAIFSLRWDDVDFVHRVIRLRGDAAKNGKTVILPLAENAIRLLEDLRANPYRPQNELVFPAPRSHGRRSNMPQAFTNRIRQKSGISLDFRPMHGLRHTFASWLASSGSVSMFELQKLLTHESPEMTRRYAHLMDSALRRAAGVADELFEITDKK